MGRGSVPLMAVSLAGVIALAPLRLAKRILWRLLSSGSPQAPDGAERDTLRLDVERRQQGDDDGDAAGDHRQRQNHSWRQNARRCQPESWRSPTSENCRAGT